MALRSNRGRQQRTWAWRRWIVSAHQEMWIERLQAESQLSWVITEKPLRKRIVLEVYVESRASALALIRRWGGRVRVVNTLEWIKTGPAPMTRIGRKLEIIHEKPRGGKKSAVPQLHIPHGLAFGSGEHATTYMLLRELMHRQDWTRATVLDLGTGSGVLALAARLLGASKIVATDFDPEAIRTARQNEALNFNQPVIRWRCADVKGLRATDRYDLVLANLFSGILAEAAAQIAGCVAMGGELWLSGILVSQKDEVTAAYRKQKLRLIEARRRGKWMMLRLA